MLKYIVLALTLSSLHAETSSEKYTSYEENLQKERDFLSESRDLKAEARRYSNDIDTSIDRRDLIDKARELKSAVRESKEDK
ncbi:MAG: hypothetical protein H8E76_01620 [Helicobacteraceae bacterium]|nr:hypothetical protein [Candidatus Sulfurimonas ponti]MBL6973871.1 hypothetical protein [Sulfurimonas sp.]